AGGVWSPVRCTRDLPRLLPCNFTARGDGTGPPRANERPRNRLEKWSNTAAAHGCARDRGERHPDVATMQQRGSPWDLTDHPRPPPRRGGPGRAHHEADGRRPRGSGRATETRTRWTEWL